MSSSKSSTLDLAQILKRMLMAENDTLYRSSDVATLEQLIEMNGGDLLASFSMVHGGDPTPSKVNISEITDQYYKEKGPTQSSSSSSSTTRNNNNNNTNYNTSTTRNNNRDRSLEITIEDEEENTNILPNTAINEDETGKQQATSSSSLSMSELKKSPQNDSMNIQDHPSSSSSSSQPHRALTLSMQMKLRALRLKLRETPMATQFEKYDDHLLAKWLEDHNEDVNATLGYIVSNSSGTAPVGASSSTSGEAQNGDIVINDDDDQNNKARSLSSASSSDISVDDPLSLVDNDVKTKRRHSALTLDMQIKIRSVKIKLKNTKNIQNVDDITVFNLLQLNDNDVQKTVKYLKECDSSTILNSGAPPPTKTLYIAPTTWDKNPSIPIPPEEIEKLKQEGRNIVNINQLPNDSLEHILEYLDKRNNLQMSAVNQYFNKCASSDYFWTSKGQKGRNGLIEPYEFQFSCKKSSKKANQDMDTVHLQEQQQSTTNNDEGPSFKSKYAKYKKEQLVQQRVMEIEHSIVQNKINDLSNRDYEWKEHVYKSWIGFIVVSIVSAVVGLVLIPLFMDEYIPNDIGTYYWLFSWLSVGIVTIPYFLIMIAHHAHLYEFYPAWTSKQLKDFRIEYTTQTFILFSSTWMWIPYIWLVGGVKNAVFPDLPILSYIAIPAYVWCLLSYLCGAPALKSSLKETQREKAAFYVSTFTYGLLLAFSVLFIILLFAKIDGLEYALNIPWSLIFVPLYAAISCFPLGFLIVPIVVLTLNNEFWAGMGTGCGLGFIVFLIVSPIYIVVPLIGAVLDSFILQTAFPFVAVFSIAYGLGLIVLGIAACVGCVFICCFLSNVQDD
ncbi:hypothetical protein FDP41_003839 [Naegleria fowleri]|uniref:F-box domain-containing protein n=1 Tax=Naegleria fowleri TaxID=5763 RepID=A0A6A5BQ68_NAEFO|nr:uncharacterized protein FDP41_003839 [Naegleria fowleri]KAF0977186.1 hypothetical protein FDP41_003839 [Naegleria fowleri]